jgi:hypothetical protein
MLKAEQGFLVGGCDGAHRSTGWILLGSWLGDASGGRYLLWGPFVKLFGCGWVRLGCFLVAGPCLVGT